MFENAYICGVTFRPLLLLQVEGCNGIVALSNCKHLESLTFSETKSCAYPNQQVKLKQADISIVTKVRL